MERPDICEVASRFTELKRSGKELLGLCPLHSEKTPSFYVHPDKQTYYCFGCCDGGDVIKFIMEREQCDFSDALRTLGMQGERRDLSDAQAHRLAELMIRWRQAVSPLLMEKCREIFRDLELAAGGGLEQELLREWYILCDFHESLWNPQGLLEMWARRDLIERLIK